MRLVFKYPRPAALCARLAPQNGTARARPFASLAPDFGFVPAFTSPQTNPIKSLFDGLVSAVVQEPTTEQSIKKKYEEKLKKAAQSEGLSVEELIRKRKAQSPTPSGSSSSQPPSSPESNSTPPQKRTKFQPAPERKDGLPSHVKKLDEIMNIDKIMVEDADRITTLWNAYHSAKSNISGVMPAQFYKDLSTRAKQYPMFILPLPRSEGYEFYLLQHTHHQTFFTPLLEYKTHLSNARPHLILTHYIDLASSKDIVLMSGDIGEGANLTNGEAQNLCYQMQMFYVTGEESVRGLVREFHEKPGEFEYGRLIEAVESLK
ncbi:hypothetical protein HK097_002562 [Rhizophlyctis rosea]|uniref:ATP11-domain-containing protein n=1 Tax=Rhizophlyctis rosea TaxID=64517 RepID=A0AAD5WXQ4_9FUNG|nr:hypothetical protein HK097_002562 [Rhizophlyctis rosea]